MIKYHTKEKAILVLEDGTVFEGKSIGFKGTTQGEICFNTSMTGYQEVFTDPSYYGQLLTMTTAYIGNYGVHLDEIESDKVMIAGLVCNQFTNTHFSRPSASGNLQDYLTKHKIVGISDIDTRKLVRYIRSKGAMNAIISSSESDDIDQLRKSVKEVPSMNGLELSHHVACASPHFYGDSNAPYKVAVLDLGIKLNILRCLAERNCYLKVFPLSTQLDEILAFNPDGIMISNGPGDPSVMHHTIELTKQLINTNMPVFGICLGHQIMALSQGIKTVKMHHGHRGVNHPIINTVTGLGEITSQNHGFVVDKESLALNPTVEITHIHLNDASIAGIKFKNNNAFSVQYHPESSAGPHDSRYLFDQFISLIKNHKKS
jgi:carbamoyl-phosphate synthase small subunit